MQLIGRIYEPDVAVLPIGDHYTMGPREAAVAVELLGVKRCVPCHWGTFPVLTGTPDELAELAPAGVDDRGRRAGGHGDGVRERWFGATGRRCRRSRSRASSTLGEALVLDDVDARRARAAFDAGTPVVVRPRRPRRSRRRSRGPRSRACSSRRPARPARARPRRADVRMIVATYSIAACDLDAAQWGVAVQSKFLAVGSVVPWAEPHVGAIATQAYANPRYGPDGLALLRDGLSARRGRASGSIAADDGRDERQLGVVDGHGGSATLHRPGCLDWAGGRTGAGYAAQGNILVSERDGRRARGDVRGDAGRPLARAAARLPRRRAGRGRRQARPAVGGAARRRAGRRLRAASRTSLVDLRVDDHTRRSRSCGGSTSCTTQLFGVDAARTSGSPSTASCAPSCASGSRARLRGRARRRVAAGPAIANLEERVDGASGSTRSCSRRCGASVTRLRGRALDELDGIPVGRGSSGGRSAGASASARSASTRTRRREAGRLGRRGARRRRRSGTRRSTSSYGPRDVHARRRGASTRPPARSSSSATRQ